MAADGCDCWWCYCVTRLTEKEREKIKDANQGIRLLLALTVIGPAVCTPFLFHPGMRRRLRRRAGSPHYCLACNHRGFSLVSLSSTVAGGNKKSVLMSQIDKPSNNHQSDFDQCGLRSRSQFVVSVRMAAAVSC